MTTRAGRAGHLATCIALVSLTGMPGLATASAHDRAGPPSLPPPRELNAAPPPEPPPASAPAPAPASPPAATTEPTPASPPNVAPTPQPAAGPGLTTGTTAPPPDATQPPPPPPAAFNFGTPQVVEPPQPPPSAAAPGAGPAATPPTAGGSASTRAPMMGPSAIDPTAAAMLPPLEIPPEPDAKGTGVFATAGVLFVAAVGEYIAAHVILKRRCVRPLAGTDLVGDEADAYIADCSITMMQAGALKLHGSINALASIGIAAAGSSIRARYDAHVDVFKTGSHKRTQTLRTAGAAMLGIGLFSWLSSAVGTWAGTIACTELDCVERLRTTQNALTLTSFALIAGGTGLLTYGVQYERRHAENATVYGQIQRLQLLPTASRGYVGLGLTGRF